MTDQLAGFSARIKRIKDPHNTYYRDGQTGTLVPKRVSRKQIRQAAQRTGGRVSFAGVMWSLLLGAAALVAARFMRWTYLGIEDGSFAADQLMIIDFGMAALVMFFLGGMIGHKTGAHMLAQVAGIAAMLALMHNLVWLAPEGFAQVFGQPYVDQVQTMTEPSSIYLRGATIPIPLA